MSRPNYQKGIHRVKQGMDWNNTDIRLNLKKFGVDVSPNAIYTWGQGRIPRKKYRTGLLAMIKKCDRIIDKNKRRMQGELEFPEGKSLDKPIAIHEQQHQEEKPGQAIAILTPANGDQPIRMAFKEITIRIMGQHGDHTETTIKAAQGRAGHGNEPIASPAGEAGKT